MRDALRAKFDQNEEFKLFTGEKVLAEANPHHNWGIVFSLDDNDICNPDMWKGRNKQGILLMEMQSTLK